MRMYYIVLLSVAFLALPYFSTSSHKRHEFWKKGIGQKMFILIFSTTFAHNISHSKKNSDLYYHKYIQVFV